MLIPTTNCTFINKGIYKGVNTLYNLYPYKGFEGVRRQRGEDYYEQETQDYEKNIDHVFA